MAELGFRVPGMRDGEEVKAITGNLRSIEGVCGVEVDLHTKWILIRGERLDTEAIRRVLLRAGFEAEV